MHTKARKSVTWQIRRVNDVKKKLRSPETQDLLSLLRKQWLEVDKNNPNSVKNYNAMFQSTFVMIRFARGTHFLVQKLIEKCTLTTENASKLVEPPFKVLSLTNKFIGPGSSELFQYFRYKINQMTSEVYDPTLHPYQDNEVLLVIGSETTKGELTAFIDKYYYSLIKPNLGKAELNLLSEDSYSERVRPPDNKINITYKSILELKARGFDEAFMGPYLPTTHSKQSIKNMSRAAQEISYMKFTITE